MEKTTLILGILIGAAGMYFLIHLLWRLGYYLLCGIIGIVRHADGTSAPRSRTHSSMEAMELPQVLKEFPDFDLDPIKAQVREQLQRNYGTRPGFSVEEITLSDYRKQGSRRELILEASVTWQEKKPVTRRISVLLEYTIPEADRMEKRSCPGCGAETAPGDLFCSYCGARIEKSVTPHWRIAKIREC